MSLMNKLKKNSTFKDGRVDVLSESKFLHQKDMTSTSIPAVNIALSGSPEGGFTSGLTMIAGPSKHFKTAFGLLMMKSYLDPRETSAYLSDPLAHDGGATAPISSSLGHKHDISRNI